MALTKLKGPDEGWDEKEMTITCPFCGSIYKGTKKDFTIVVDNPKQYNYEFTCEGCGNTVRF